MSIVPMFCTCSGREEQKTLMIPTLFLMFLLFPVFWVKFFYNIIYILLLLLLKNNKNNRNKIVKTRTYNVPIFYPVPI